MYRDVGVGSTGVVPRMAGRPAGHPVLEAGTQRHFAEEDNQEEGQELVHTLLDGAPLVLPLIDRVDGHLGFLASIDSTTIDEARVLETGAVQQQVLLVQTDDT